MINKDMSIYKKITILLEFILEKEEDEKGRVNVEFTKEEIKELREWYFQL